MSFREGRAKTKSLAPHANQRGVALIVVLMIAAILAIIGGAMATQYVNGVAAASVLMDKEFYRANVKSAMETFSTVYRLSNIRYSGYVKDCVNANDFTRALREGHGCTSVGPYTVFTAADISSIAATADLGVSFPNPCVISQNASSCTAANPIFRLDFERMTFDIYLDGTLSEKNLAEFTLVLISPRTPYPLTNRFAIQGSLALLGHLESSDVTVVAEYPSALHSCLFDAWNPLRSGAGCQTFQQLGGGTGLGSYRDRFFGLRSFDGQIVDMNGLSGATYLVDESGFLAGQKVFPEYCKQDFVNADDFTILSNTNVDEIYIASGVGQGSRITYIRAAGPGNCTRHPVCELGLQGWGQAFSGIAADSASNILVPPADLPGLTLLTAVFYLKTDAGVFLTAYVTSRAGAFPDPNSVYDPALNRTFTCSVNYDSQKQSPERSRTLGFERGMTKSKPYFVY